MPDLPHQTPINSASVNAPFTQYRNQCLYIEDVALSDLAQQYGTPLYVYSKASMQQQWLQYQQAVDGHSPATRIAYAVKANSSLAILQQYAQWGACFDVVSGGELQRVLQAGGQANQCVFSGVGKQHWEIAQAIEAGIFSFNVESESELQQIAHIAEAMQIVANVSLRVNPDVDAQTHPYISTGLRDNKFGIAMEQAPSLYAMAQQHPWLKIVGIACHIGSQITSTAPFIDALHRVISLIHTLNQQGITLQHIDMGGGMGIAYTPQATTVDIAELLQCYRQTLQAAGLGHLQLLIEPGRSLIGNAGLLLTQVLHLKKVGDKPFAIVDAGMNDLMRPTLYEAYHHILNTTLRPEQEAIAIDVVGPVCETGDWLAKGRVLALQTGDTLAIESAGAYSASMGSQYNSRPRPAEVLIDGKQAHLIRHRESLEQLWANEVLIHA